MAIDIVIGNVHYTMDVPSFGLMKKAWPFVMKMQQKDLSVMDQAEAMIQMVSIFLSKKHPELTPEVIEDTLSLSEVRELVFSLPKILTEAGVLKPGEPKAPEAGESP